MANEKYLFNTVKGIIKLQRLGNLICQNLKKSFEKEKKIRNHYFDF